MAKPLMPKATAVWLVENTTLTFEQIALFCDMHTLEIQAIADGEVAANIVGLDPVATGQITAEEIERCANNPSAQLQMAKTDLPETRTRPKGARYTPVSKRQDRPDAIAWLLRNHPQLSDAQICKLVGTTKATIKAVRENTHWNAANIKPRDPVTLGLCTQTDLNAAVALADSRKPEPASVPAEPRPATPEEPTPEAGAGAEESELEGNPPSSG